MESKLYIGGLIIRFLRVYFQYLLFSVNQPVRVSSGAPCLPIHVATAFLGYMGSPSDSLVVWAMFSTVAMFAALRDTALGTITPEWVGELTYILRICALGPAFLSVFTAVMMALKPPFKTTPWLVKI